MTGLPMKQSLEELLEEAGKVRQEILEEAKLQNLMKQSLGELLEEAGKLRAEIEDAHEAVRNGKPSHSLSPRGADKEFVKNNNTNKED